MVVSASTKKGMPDFWPWLPSPLPSLTYPGDAKIIGSGEWSANLISVCDSLVECPAVVQQHEPSERFILDDILRRRGAVMSFACLESIVMALPCPHVCTDGLTA
jgi:hypothetical protein